MFCEGNLVLLSTACCILTKVYLELNGTSAMELFCENSKMFDWVLNTPPLNFQDGMTPLHLATFHNLKGYVHALACGATLAGKNVDFSYKDNVSVFPV